MKLNQIGDVTKAVIIGGGKGERLGEQFSFTQKCLLPILGRPILSYVIESLEIAGIKEIIIVTNHHSDDVENFIKYSKPFDSKIIIKKINSIIRLVFLKKCARYVIRWFYKIWKKNQIN